jgi:hypothetical protein
MKEYYTVEKVNFCDFDYKISVLLKDGWELYGNPYTRTTYDIMGVPKDDILCQALIR